MANLEFEHLFGKTPEGFDKRVRSVLASLPSEGKNMGNRKTTIHHFKGRTVAAACAAAVVLVGAIPVTAAVLSHRQERMENMTKEEQAQIVADLEERQAEGDTYSRKLSEKEAERYNVLLEKYNEDGIFPEGEVTIVSDDAQANGEGVYYNKISGIYLLPERELTDEELLQMIDRNYKVTYSAEKVVDDEIKELQANAAIEEEQVIRKVVAAGGIDKETAINKASELLEEIGKVDSVTFRKECYFIDEKIGYSVKFTDANGLFYYIFVSSKDGSLLSYDAPYTERSGEVLSDKTVPELTKLAQKAEAWAEEISGTSGEAEIAYYMLDEEQALVEDEVTFCVRTGDNQGVIVTLHTSDSSLAHYGVEETDFNDSWKAVKQHNEEYCKANNYEFVNVDIQ